MRKGREGREVKDRIEQIRGKAFAVPFAAGIAFFCVLGLSMAPMFSSCFLSR